ncbi:MAG TPA: glutathione synthase [Sphingomonadales bacterium]|nr:glutathione synthase [Sphingomonadales bacterium]
MASKPLKVAVQMDPLEGTNIEADSSFALMEEAQKRGHALYYYQPRELSLNEGKVLAFARKVKVKRVKGNHFTAEPPAVLDLSKMDVVLLRQDPPFDMAYVTTTHLLEMLQPEVLVVNDPAAVRNAPEKLFVARFSHLMPPTLIAHRRNDILAFRKTHRDIVLKPLYGNGGAGVFHVSPQDENLNALLEMFTQFYKEPVIVQKYIPSVREGDKRIILVDGEIAGGFTRVPAKGEARSNLHVGGAAKKSELTKREREICAEVGPELKRRGLLFAGLDVAGDRLLEINVTSPTGIQEMDRFYGTDTPAKIWDAIEKRLR